ncbi:MAG: LysR family transcriptional regulator [Flammeovirgaceae bacterium]
MNLQFIKYFVVLSETGNFTQAAQKVHVVQSSFSTGIKKLEQQLNCKLFYRDNRQVILTDEGQQLLPKAKQLLAIWNDMEGTFSAERNVPLKLGIVSEIDFNAIAPLMKTYHELYPKCQIQIIEKEEAELHQLLKNKSIDGFFLKYIPFDHTLFNHRLVRKDKLVFAVPPNHPFALKDKVTLQEVDGEDFIERTNCSLYKEVEASFHQGKIAPHVVFQAKGDDMAKALVASGIAISLVPHIEKVYQNIKFVPIADQHFYRKIFLIWNKENTSKALNHLLMI